MWESIIPALISMFGSLGSSFIAKKSADENQDKQNAFNVQQEQNARSYNSPVAQLGRLSNAGINPLGQDFQSVGNSVVSADSRGADILGQGLQSAMTPLQQLSEQYNKTNMQNKELEARNRQLDLYEKSVLNTCSLGRKQLEVMQASIDDIKSQIGYRNGWQSKLVASQIRLNASQVGLNATQERVNNSISLLNNQSHTIRGMEEYDSKTLLSHARNNESYNNDLIREMRTRLDSKAQSYVYALESQRIQMVLDQMAEELKPWQKKALEAQYQEVTHKCMYGVNMLSYAEKIEGWKFWSNEILGTAERVSDVVGNVSKLGLLKSHVYNHTSNYNYNTFSY